jgi:PAS domain S-box-containing protein
MLRPEDREKYITAELNGTRCIVFHKILNEGSVLPQARLVCVYSLAAAEARQSQVRRGILVAAFLVLMTGLGASHAFSTTLSRPVEALEMEKKDQSARREAAEAARDMNELKYRGIFENAVEGIFVITPEGCGLSFNPSMARLLGFDTAGQLLDATQSGCDSFFEPPAVAKSLLQRVQTEGVVSNAEAQMRTHDGRHLWVSLNARGVRDSSGNLLHVEGTLEDITERRQAAETLQRVNRDLEKAVAELKATQNQLVQQERLSALGQMASGIAHDFNNSLMPITGYTELLLSNPEMLKDQKKTQTYLEIIRTAAKDGASIVSRLREFYRSSHPSDDFAPVDLPPLLREAILLTQPKWKRQALAGGAEIRVIEELAPVPVIQGNESSLRETFTNLIFNAVDAMPSGGTLTFRTRIEDDNVVVELADTGTGMSEEVRRRCLEPFFTTKGERGTGLGLSMVFGIMQRHGGTLDLKSRLGQGTAFLLRFPKRVSEPERPEVEAELPLKPGALRVLLAEDERQVREVLTAFLELDGHRVRAVSNGSEALAKFGEETFDVVITDKAMPGMNGAQLANEIKQRAPRVPVILLSGFNSPGHDEHVPDVDIVAAKPITMTTLRTVLRQAAELASGPA